MNRAAPTATGAPIASANSDVIRVPQATRATPQTEGVSSGFHWKEVRKLTESALIAWIAWVIRNATIAPISTSRNSAEPRAVPANTPSPRREAPVSPAAGPRRPRRGPGGPDLRRLLSRSAGPGGSVRAGDSPLIVLLTVQYGRADRGGTGSASGAAFVS